MVDSALNKLLQARFAVGVLVALLCLLPAPGADAGQLYRWVDDQGEIHFTDTPPASATDKQHSVMDSAGRVIEDREALEKEQARRAEQRARRDAAEARRREEQAAREEQQRRDRIITETFVTERDIRLTRDDRLEAVDSQIRILDHTIKQLQQDREWEVRQVKKLTIQSRDVDAAMARIDALDSRLSRRLQQRRALIEKRQRVEERFAYYLERFRVLSGGV